MAALAHMVDDDDGWERLALAVLAVPPDSLAEAIRQWIIDFDGPQGVHAELAAVLADWHTGKRGGRGPLAGRRWSASGPLRV